MTSSLKALGLSGRQIVMCGGMGLPSGVRVVGESVKYDEHSLPPVENEVLFVIVHFWKFTKMHPGSFCSLSWNLKGISHPPGSKYLVLIT